MHRNGYTKFNEAMNDADNIRADAERYLMILVKDCVNHRERRINNVVQIVEGIQHWAGLYALELIDRASIDWNINRIKEHLKTRLK